MKKTIQNPNKLTNVNKQRFSEYFVETHLFSWIVISSFILAFAVIGEFMIANLLLFSYLLFILVAYERYLKKEKDGTKKSC